MVNTIRCNIPLEPFVIPSFSLFFFSLSRLLAVFAGKTEPRSGLRELLPGMPGSPNTVGMHLKRRIASTFVYVSVLLACRDTSFILLSAKNGAERTDVRLMR
ncbi:hypothetical protein GGI42DRAFT_226897 [Trichoderma sp. SZMC 28013]